MGLTSGCVHSWRGWPLGVRGPCGTVSGVSREGQGPENIITGWQSAHALSLGVGRYCFIGK